jgi:4-amino-4-deoxy-L-arabinose transferase-like glycosyltransferase
VPHYLGNLRIQKPPLIYWCQATSMAILGDTDFAARLPSSLAITAVAALLAWMTWRFTGPRRAVWTTFIFCTTALTIACAKMCVTDGVLLLCVVIGQGCLLKIWWTHGDQETVLAPAGRQGTSDLTLPLLLWVSIGIGALTKGPAIFLHVGLLIVLAFLDLGRANWRSPAAWKRVTRWWLETRPLLGLVILTLIVVPWLVLVIHRAPEFLPRMLGQLKGHATGNMEGHRKWPGYHLLLIFGTYFPWSLLLPASIGLGLRYHRGDRAVRFALAAAIGPWAVMELWPTKLPYYVMPAFPALAFLTAHAIERCTDSVEQPATHDDFRRPFFIVATMVWALVVVAVSVVPWLAVRYFPDTPRAPLVVFTIVGLIYTASVAALIARRRLGPALATMGLGPPAMIFVLYGWLLPSLSFLTASRDAGRQLTALGAGHPTPVAMIDFREPSLAFYQGGSAVEHEQGDVKNGLAEQWLVTTSEASNRVPPAIQSRYELVWSRPTLMYAGGGRRTELLILRKK